MQLPIPDDWTEDDGYSFALVCVPRSTQWHAIFKGAIYALTRGRSWDINTGQVTDVQIIGKEIFESLCLMDCNLFLGHLDRIATALESMDGKQVAGEPTITIDDALLQQLKALIETWEQNGGSNAGGVLKTIKDLLELFTFIKALLPGHTTAMTISQLIRMIMDTMYRKSFLRASWINATSGKVANLLNGGEDLIAAGVTEDDYTRVMDLQFDTSGLKQNLPFIGWLFGPTANDLPVEDLIALLYDYFESNGGDPDVRDGQTLALKDVEAKLEEIRTLYETRSIAETTAGNSRNAELVEILDAVENVLGGTFDPNV
jgi:hypothetical protein